MHRSHARRGGFTLIELLIVIAISTLLLVLLFPTAKGMMEVAKNAKCLQNLRAVGGALTSFSAENHGLVPPRSLGYDRPSGMPKPPAAERPWCSRLFIQGYVADARILYCPSYAPFDVQKAEARLSQGGAQPTYGMRTWAPKNSRGKDYLEWREEDKPLAAIEKPSDFFLVADSYWSELGTQGYGIAPGAKSQVVHLRHGKRANALFADGHVEAKDAEYFSNLEKVEVQGGYANGNELIPGAKIFAKTLEDTEQ